MSTEKKQSLLSQIIEKGMEEIKRPFVIKRINRAFESSKDSIEEQLMNKEAGLNAARENLVNAAKREESLGKYIQALIDVRLEIKALKEAQEVLNEEKEDLL